MNKMKHYRKLQLAVCCDLFRLSAITVKFSLFISKHLKLFGAHDTKVLNINLWVKICPFLFGSIDYYV